MLEPHNTSERIPNDDSNMMLLEELEQTQVRMDELEESLAQARARCYAAESLCTRARIERWKMETQLSHACNNISVGADGLEKAWKNKHAADQQVAQTLQARGAALADLEEVTSVWDIIASRLVELRTTIESVWESVRIQIGLEPLQEEQAIEHGHQEPNEEKEGQQYQADGKVLVGALPPSDDH
jgi:hypothetical protein